MRALSTEDKDEQAQNRGYFFLYNYRMTPEVNREPTEANRLDAFSALRNLRKRKGRNSLKLRPEMPVWCRRRDSNPHGYSPLPPQDSVSASSTTSAQRKPVYLKPTNHNQFRLQMSTKKLDCFLSLFVL